MKEPEASANENCESFILIGKLQMLQELGYMKDDLTFKKYVDLAKGCCKEKIYTDVIKVKKGILKEISLDDYLNEPELKYGKDYLRWLIKIPKMKEAIDKGLDIYSYATSLIFNKPYDECILSAASFGTSDYMERDNLRNVSKVLILNAYNKIISMEALKEICKYLNLMSSGEVMK